MRIVILLLICGGLIAASHWGSEWLISLIDLSSGSGLRSHALHIAMAGIALYSALMGIPFVPGMEISLALLAAFGHQIAMPIYFAIITALSISYLIGRLVPLRMSATLFASLGQHKAKGLVERLEPLSTEQRLETLIKLAPRRALPVLLRHRYIAVAVALNVPGNAIIGGGGGIVLLAGISGLFTFPRYLAVMSLSVLPIPLFILLMGR